MGLRQRITIPLLLLVSFLAVVLLGYSYYISIDRRIKNVEGSLEAIAASRANNIGTYISDFQETLNVIASEDKLIDHLANEEHDHTCNECPCGIKDRINSFEDIRLEIEEVSVTNKDGLVILSTNQDMIGEDLSGQDVFQKGISSQYISDIIKDETSQEISIEFSTPISKDGDSQGVLIVEIDPTYLFTILEDKSGLGESGEAFLVNGGGMMVSNSKFKTDVILSQRIKKEQRANCLDTGTVGSFDSLDVYEPYYNYRNIEVLGVSQKVDRSDWCLLVEKEKSEAIEDITNLFKTFLFIVAGGIIFLGVVVFMIVTGVVSPLKKLRKGVEIIQKGNLDYKIGLHRDDEIGQLASSFDKMAQTLKKSSELIDKKVEVQTKEMINQKKKLEKQQKAILNVLEDIGQEKKRAESEKEKIDTVVQSIGDGVFVVDRNYKITKFNKVASDISGFDKDEVIGRKFQDILRFVDAKGREVSEKVINLAFLTSSVHQIPDDALLIRKDGKKVPVADSVAPIKDSEGKSVGCVVVFRDVTIEREIDRMKTEFVSIASHQLRTPLSAIRWALEMLLNGDAGKVTVTQKVLLERSYSSATRMVALVNSLLNVSRIESGQLKVDSIDTDIIEVAENIVKEQEVQMSKKKQNFEFKIPDEKIQKIKTDPKLLGEVITSVLSNAIKYTPEKGKISFQITMKKRMIVFTIKDTGIGIPKSEHKKLFTKFYRSENAAALDSEGTGLGLYMSKSIIQLLGGDIEVESEENKGTTVKFSIPIKGIKGKKGTKNLA